MIGVGMKMNLQLIHFLLVEEEVAEMKDQDLYVIVTHTHTHTLYTYHCNSWSTRSCCPRGMWEGGRGAVGDIIDKRWREGLPRGETGRDLI